jgi:gentisate 1,2-dioxygenase
VEKEPLSQMRDTLALLAAFLFSFSDAPVMKALDLYREEAQG